MSLCFLACMLGFAGCADSHAALDPQTPSAVAQRDPSAYGSAGTGSAAPQVARDSQPEPAYDYRSGYGSEQDAPPAPAEAADAVAVEPAGDCPDLGALAATGGAIEFRADGSAAISVTLENTSDEAFVDYPGLHVWWWITDVYAPGHGDDLLLYALLPRDRWQHVLEAAAADVLPWGRELIVQAEPFARSTTGEDCRSGEILEFSAPLPPR